MGTLKKYWWLVAIILVFIVIGLIWNIKLPKNIEYCARYQTPTTCEVMGCDWPGPTCALPGQNCGFAYNPDLDKCLPKK